MGINDTNALWSQEPIAKEVGFEQTLSITLIVSTGKAIDDAEFSGNWRAQENAKPL